MRHEVSVTFPKLPTFRVDLGDVPPMTHETARHWLDEQFTQMGCEPLRPTGKLLTADKVVVIAQAAGPGHFSDEAWSLAFARAASAALGKASVHVDVAALGISY